ncbi:MAG TPA: flagellar hook-basal body complex protein [Steroidobacter sp.]
MLDALYVAAIGLQAQKERLDTLANNLANFGTTAFKRQSVDFAALLDRAPHGQRSDATSSADARPNRVLRLDMSSGEVHGTGRGLDLAIIGEGYLEVELPSEQTGYTRVGSLQIGTDGRLGLLTGQALKADVRIPGDAREIEILGDGSVIGLLAGDAEPTTLGQIELARFANPEILEYRGEGVFIAPEGADPSLVRPGEEGTAPFAVRSLEGSNVRMTDEMVSLMLMQRVYELNSRVAQVADELMGMTNNLRRG